MILRGNASQLAKAAEREAHELVAELREAWEVVVGVAAGLLVVEELACVCVLDARRGN